MKTSFLALPHGIKIRKNTHHKAIYRQLLFGIGFAFAILFASKEIVCFSFANKSPPFYGIKFLIGPNKNGER
jgi:hypothetical protein